MNGMNDKGLSLWAAVLLLVGGLVHLIPGLYSGLADLTGGFPWIQVVVGILSVIVALVMFAGDKQEEGAKEEKPDQETTTSSEGEKSSESGTM